MRNVNVKNKLIWTLALAVFAINAALSGWVPAGYAQFIDRIVRPCGGTSLGTVRVTTTNVLINPCPGGVVTINGVPITPGAGLPDPGSNGFVVRTALNTDLARTLTVSSPIVIANGTGVAGNPLFSCPTCVTSAAALTNFALMTGAALQGSKTPSVTATLLANGNISTPGSVTTGNAGGVSGALDLSGLTSGTVTITVAAIAGTWTLRLPIDDGTAGQFLQTDGVGVTSWQTVAAGVTPNATVGTIPYLSAATVYSDSPITRLSATHLQVFAGGVGGADFDSSAPSVSLNNGRYLDNGTNIKGDSGSGTTEWQSTGIVALGDYDGNVNSNYIAVDDPNKQVNIFVGKGFGAFVGLNIEGLNNTATLGFPTVNNTALAINDTTKTITLTADATTGIITSSAHAVLFDGLLQTTGGDTVYGNGTPGIAGNGTLDAGSRDSAGKVSITNTGGSTVTLTFATAFPNAPACNVVNETTANLARATSTTTTVVLGGVTVNGDKYAYQCIGY